MQKKLLLGLTFLLAPALTQAQSPLIPYSGRLEKNGQAASGAHDFRFALFADVNDGASCLVTVSQASDVCGLWWGQADSVEVYAGRFSVLLGQAPSPLSGSVLAQNQLWIAVAVRKTGAADFTLMQGKQRVAEVPRAAAAANFAVSGALTVAGSATFGDEVTVSNVLSLRQDSSAGGPAIAFANTGDQVDAGKIVYRPSWDRDALAIVGAGDPAGGRKVRVWDDLHVSRDLSVNGAVNMPAGALQDGSVVGADLNTSAFAFTEWNVNVGTHWSGEIGPLNTRSICFLREIKYSGGGQDSTNSFCGVEKYGSHWRIYQWTGGASPSAECRVTCLSW